MITVQYPEAKGLWVCCGVQVWNPANRRSAEKKPTLKLLSSVLGMGQNENWTRGSTLYFYPGLWSSSPSRHLWGFPEEGTTGQHPPCCESRFPQSAKGFHCSSRAEVKATSISANSPLPWLPAQVQDTSTAQHCKCFRLKHPLSPSEHPEQGQLPPQGDQLLPTPQPPARTDI